MNKKYTFHCLLILFLTGLSISSCSIKLNSEQANEPICMWFITPAITKYQKQLAKHIDENKSKGVGCLMSGRSYDSIVFKNLKGSEHNPIVIHGNNSKIIGRTVNSKTGVWIEDSEYVHMVGLSIEKFLFGLQIFSSTKIGIYHSVIQNVGQEGVIVQNRKPITRITSDIMLRSLSISTTGRSIPKYGEGIYIGNSKDGFGIIKNIHIYNNIIKNTTNEAIDVKRNVKSVYIVGNKITDSFLKFNGAITIGVGGNIEPADTLSIVIGNHIQRIQNSNGYTIVGIALGNGTAVVSHNYIKLNEIKKKDLCLYKLFSAEHDSKLLTDITIPTRLLLQQLRGLGIS